MKLSKEKSTALILSHYTFGSPDSEDTYHRVLRALKEKVYKAVLIVNPFPEFGSRYCYCVIYENQEKVAELRATVTRGPAFLQYAHHLFLIYYFLFRTGVRYDLCIALENFSFIAVYPFRFFGFIKKQVYYSVDFVAQRFSNPILNWLYHAIDKFACKFSDANWMMVRKQVTARKIFGILPSNSSPFTIVPIGYNRKIITIKPVDKIDSFGLVYAGALSESMGVQLILESMPSLLRKFPKIHLTIIGAGKYSTQLKDSAQRLNIIKQVKFTGYVESFNELTTIIANNSIALAPYVPIPGGYSNYADPSKIKLYMCCGLPVITTKVTPMTSMIKKTRSGVIADYSKKDLENAIIYLLKDKGRYKKYKEAAVKLSEKFDMDYIINNPITKIPY